MKSAIPKIFSVFILMQFLFCSALLSAQVVKLEKPVKVLSLNADDSVLSVATEDFLSAFKTSSYASIVTIDEKNVNRSVFSKERNEELLVSMTDGGKFLLYKRAASGKKSYEKTESYLLSDYAKGKTIVATAFSNRTNYIASACSDFSIQLYFKLRFTQTMFTVTLKGHNSAIKSLSFSNDEKHLVSVSEDGEAIVWDCATYARIASIENVYMKSDIPLFFTSDGRLVSMEDEHSFRVSDIKGRKKIVVDTESAVRLLKPLRNSDRVSVLNENNEIVVYSIKSKKPIGNMRLPEAENAEITDFAFCRKENAIFAGCADGSVHKIKYGGENVGGGEGSSDGQGDGENSENGGSSGSFKTALKTEKTHFLSVSALSGFLQPEKTNFKYLFGLDAGYRNSFLTSPLYIGAGFRTKMALPKKDFPSHYEDFSGNEISPPFLWLLEAYAPVGIEVVLDRKGYAVLFEEVSLTGRVGFISHPKVAASKPFFSLGGRITTGITLRFVTFSVALDYDSTWNLFPEISIGGRIDFKEKTTKGGKSL